MKRYVFVFAAVCAAMTACNKNESPVETPSVSNPIQMTLTASIGADTKVTYTDEGNVLKSAWKAGDKVSLLAVDAGGKLISNDVFTAKNGGKTATFEGTFTNDPNTAAVWVYYPALTEGTGEDAANAYHAPSPITYEPIPGKNLGSVYGVYKDADFLSIGVGYPLQKKNCDPSDLCHYAVMSGQADTELLAEGKMGVSLAHRSYVIKATITFPDEGVTVYNLMLTFNSEDRQTCVGGSGWTYIKESVSFGSNSQVAKPYLCFGDDVDSGTGTGITLVGNTLVAYFTLYACEYYDATLGKSLETQLKAGDKVSITSSTQDGDYFIDDIVFKKDIMLENGMMYRMAATLEKKITTETSVTNPFGSLTEEEW